MVIPLFFVGIGLKADFGSIGDAPYLVLALLAVAVAGKIAGCALGARLSGDLRPGHPDDKITMTCSVSRVRRRGAEPNVTRRATAGSARAVGFCLLPVPNT